MKKKYIPYLLFLCSGLLILGYVVRLIVDYYKLYQFGSSPFYLYIIFRWLEFIIPALVLFVIGIIIKKKVAK